MAWASEDYFSGGKPFKLTLTINPNGQSVSGNWTDVDYSLYIHKTGYSPSWSNNTSHYSVSVGQTVSNSQNWQGNFTYDFRSSSQKLLRAGTKRIYHYSNGTSPVYAGANCSASGLGNAAVSDINRTLPTIPRKSIPTVKYGSLDAGNTQTILTHRASSSFTHTVTYKFGGQTGTIATKTTTADPTWTPPLSLLGQIPNSTSGTCTITVTTYSGNTNLGSSSVNFTLKAPSSVVPDFNDITITETNQTVIDEVGEYVQNASEVDVSINGASGVYGSSIRDYRIEVGGTVVNAQSGAGVRIPSSGSVQVKGTVTDSRGRKKTKTQTIQVLPYNPPKINNITFQRALADGTPAGDGSYIRVNMNISASSLLVGGVEKNQLGYSILTRQHNVGSFELKKSVNPLAGNALTFNSFDVVSTYDVEESWDVQANVIDLFATSVQQGVIAVGSVFMHWGGRGEGVGIGKYWERGGLDVKGQIYQNSGAQVLDSRNLHATPWEDLTPYLASGITYVADGLPELAGLRGRRVGPYVELSLGNFSVDSMKVGVSGNVSNHLILTGLPEKFRPAGGACIQSGWNGRVWSGYITASGDLIFAATVPSSDQTATQTWVNQTYSGTAFYPAGNPAST